MVRNIYSVKNIIVNRLGNNNLSAQCSCISTEYEALAWIITDTRNFAVKDAGLEIYRSPEEKPGFRSFPQLIGVQAYLNCGKAWKTILEQKDGFAWNLFSHCIKGIIQSETFCYRERGFKDRIDYLDSWNREFKNGCYKFTHMENSKNGWFEYIGDTPRKYNLFNRSYIVSINNQENGRRISGTIIDSYHELNIELLCDEKNNIVQCMAEPIRIPDNMCVIGIKQINEILGRNILLLDIKAINNLVGGMEGCSHIVDILNEIRKNLCD